MKPYNALEGHIRKYSTLLYLKAVTELRLTRLKKSPSADVEDIIKSENRLQGIAASIRDMDTFFVENNIDVDIEYDIDSNTLVMSHAVGQAGEVRSGRNEFPLERKIGRGGNVYEISQVVREMVHLMESGGYPIDRTS